MCNDINYALTLIPKEQERLLDQYYNYGYSQTEIAKSMHVSQPTVCRMIKKALAALRGLVA